MFNNYFTSVFSAPQEDKEDNGVGKFPAAEFPFRDIVLHVGEVEAVLKSLDPNKATGPDEIPARILKVTATTIAPSLCKLFNRPLGEGYIPSEWKLANVMPVYKKDEKDHVENYRPISLLCLISKVPRTLRFEPYQHSIRSSDCGLSARVSQWTFMRHKSTGDPRLHRSHS